MKLERTTGYTAFCREEGKGQSRCSSGHEPASSFLARRIAQILRYIRKPPCCCPRGPRSSVGSPAHPLERCRWNSPLYFRWWTGFPVRDPGESFSASREESCLRRLERTLDMVLGSEKEALGDGDPKKEDEEEEEQELVDPLTTIREHCEQIEKCVKARERLEMCTDRVSSHPNTEEDCTEELFDFLHARDHCVAHTLFESVK